MKKLTLALVAILLALTCVFAACGKKDNTDKPADGTDTPVVNPTETVKKDDLTKIAEQFKADYVANYLDLYATETVAVIESEKSATLIKIQAATTAAEAQKAADDFFTFLKAQKTIIDEAKDLLAKIGDVALADEGLVGQLKTYDAQLVAAAATATTAAKKAALEAYDAATKKAVDEKVAQLDNLKDAKKAADKKDAINDEIKGLKADYDAIVADASAIFNLTDANRYTALEKKIAAFAAEYDIVVGSDAYKEIFDVATLDAAKAIVDKAYEENPVMKYMAAVIAQRDALAAAAEEARWIEYVYIDKNQLIAVPEDDDVADNVKPGSTYVALGTKAPTSAPISADTVVTLEDGTIKYVNTAASGYAKYATEKDAIAHGVRQPVKVELRVNTTAGKVAEYKLSLTTALKDAMEAYNALKAVSGTTKTQYGFVAGNVAFDAYTEIAAIADAYDQSLTDANTLYNGATTLFTNADDYTSVRAKSATLATYTLDAAKNSKPAKYQENIVDAIDKVIATFRGTNAKGNDTYGADTYYQNYQKYGVGDYAATKDGGTTKRWFVLDENGKPAITYIAWQYHYELDGETIPMNKFVAIDELFADNFVLQTLDASNYSALVKDAVMTAQNVAIKQSMNTQATVVAANASFAAIATQTDPTKVAGDYETFVTDALAVVADTTNVTDADVRDAYQAAADAATAYLEGNVTAAKNAVAAAAAKATDVGAAVVSTSVTYMAKRAENTLDWLAKYIGEGDYADSYALNEYKDSKGNAAWTLKTDVLYMTDRDLTEVADARVSKINDKVVDVAKSEAVAAKLLSVYTVAQAIVDEQAKIDEAQAEVVEAAKAAALALREAGDANAITALRAAYNGITNGKTVSKKLYSTNAYADYTAYTFVTTAMDAYNNDDVVVKEASAGKTETKKSVSAILTDAGNALNAAYSLTGYTSTDADTNLKALLKASADLSLNKMMQAENADYAADYAAVVLDAAAKIKKIAEDGDKAGIIDATTGKDAAGNYSKDAATKLARNAANLNVLFSEKDDATAGFDAIYKKVADDFLDADANPATVSTTGSAVAPAIFKAFLDTVASPEIVPASAWWYTEVATSNTDFANYLSNIGNGAAYTGTGSAANYFFPGVTATATTYKDSNDLEVAAKTTLSDNFDNKKAAYKGIAKLKASTVNATNVGAFMTALTTFTTNNNADYLNLKVSIALFDESTVDIDILTEAYRESMLAKNYAVITTLAGTYTQLANDPLNDNDWNDSAILTVDGVGATLAAVTSIKDANFADTNYKPDEELYDLSDAASLTGATVSTLKTVGGLN